jgi:tetratricopeptide (TPR) repeat protein
MKKPVLAFIATFLSLSLVAQHSYHVKNPDQQFNEAREYYQKGLYNQAYPIFKELQQSLRERDRFNQTITSQEIDYYTIASALMQDEAKAEQDALSFINLTRNNARVQMMNFHLAEHYFRNQRFADAISQYEQAGIANLSNREIADMKFHQGYSYFSLC